MKTLFLFILLITTFCLTGCDTLLVENRPGYQRRPVVYSDGYYDRDRRYRDDRYRNDRYRDDRRRDVRVVRTYDNGYYQPAPAVRRSVVVVNQPNRYRSKSRTVVNRRVDRDDDRNRRSKTAFPVTTT